MHLFPINLMQIETNIIRIAITSDSANHRNYLQKAMELRGIEVVLNESLTKNFIKKLKHIESDVILFDMESIEDEHLEYLEQLLEQKQVPVIINDVSALTINEVKISSKWNNQLLEKISAITGHDNWVNDKATTEIMKATKVVDNYQPELAKNVWVLGASLGGPEALKHFLSGIPNYLPVAFIVAQHLGENFVSHLAKQLARHTVFSVMVAKDGHVLRHGEILIAPTEKRLVINSIGAVELKNIIKQTRYTPSINTVIKDVVTRYNDNAGTIIFSGMCDDGVEGCEAIAAKGGQVWTQNSESCVISAMPESVANKMQVNISGTPEMLAKQLVSYIKR